MTGGLIQLVAHGIEDKFLTGNPTITFFKVVYRRHTSFTKEEIRQNFTSEPSFGRNVSCHISRSGDLIGSIFLVVKLPKVVLPDTQRVKFAWVKRLGFAMIKSVNIVINGHQIDKHYGDWLNVWSELTGAINGPHERGFKKMIGDIDELTNFDYVKDEYTLFIPLQFWFCKFSGSALPITALHYSDIEINVEFETQKACYLTSPTHSITIRDNLPSFVKGEYIEQNVDGDLRAGVFVDFDPSTKKLYYDKVTETKISGITVASDFNTSNPVAVSQLESSDLGQQYKIVGKTSGYSTFAEFNSFSQSMPIPIKNLKFVDSFLLVDYYFLDTEERVRFSQSRHDYLIDQLYYTAPIEISDTNRNIKMVSDHPCRLMVWTVQMKYIKNSKDYFNYTDTYQRKVFSYEPYEVPLGDPIGNNLILSSTILLNGYERMSFRNNKYFEHVQQHQNIKYSPQVGINHYSFAINPFTPLQPSGSINTSQIDNIEIKMTLSPIISPNNLALFTGYSLCYNILRIVNGLGALVFTK
jgi:hypothetical protein